jgi:ZIP family zinc transporter
VTAKEMLLIGFAASAAAGLATGVGALPCLFVRKIPQKLMDVLLGGAAGVMLAATSFSLIVPGIEYGTDIYGSGVIAVLVVVGGILAGGLFLDRADKWLPHEHFIKGREGPSSNLRRVWLFILAITLHNFPEGLAVGVGFGGGTEESMNNGISLAIGIGLQNMPEGLAVALPLMREGYGRGYALWIATATGLVEPLGGLLGVGLVSIARPILPAGLAFAAGAMLFVISDEIIPETHRKGHARAATFGVMIGFVVMMALDNLLG